MLIRQEFLTDIIDEMRWWGLSTKQSCVWLVIFSGTRILIQSEERCGTWVGLYRFLLINDSRFIIWFYHSLIYDMQHQLWKSKSSILQSYSYISFWQMNWYVCNLISSRCKLEKVPSRPDFSFHSGNISSSIARFYQC